MIKISCPSCRRPMQIEDDDPDTEWECPTCEAAFVVKQGTGADLEFVITEPGRHSVRPAVIVTTGNEIAERAIASYIGIVRGIVVRSPSIAQGLLGGLQQMVGGNIDSYAEVCEAARDEAYQRMVQHAQAKGADAIIGMRYDATEFAEGVTEVLAYGTAVRLTHD